MRVDREVRYCITAQYVNKEDNKIASTGIKSQKFGLGEKTSKSEVSNAITKSTWYLKVNTCAFK